MVRKDGWVRIEEIFNDEMRGVVGYKSGTRLRYAQPWVLAYERKSKHGSTVTKGP